MKVIEMEYGKIIIGKNKNENIKIIQAADPNNLWFHLKDYPSCHIVVQNNRLLTKSELNDVAWMVVKNTNKYKDFKNLRISHCLVKDLIICKQQVGTVFLKREQIIQL